eukprot:9924930-Lingulodinium_polyedra.AAC.1
MEKLAAIVQDILGAMGDDELQELLGQRLWSKAGGWDSDWMDSPALLDEMSSQDLKILEVWAL